jgi:hypothetical protein
MSEAVAVAVLARAPLAGFAKTRLIPVLGAQGAARLQARLIAHAVASACTAAIGPVALWVTPDEHHPDLQAIAAEKAVVLKRQCDGDLGERMLAALAAASGPALVIGTDCPALTPHHLRVAADILRSGSDAVVIPAEDGGYVLIGTRAAQPALFCDMRWSTPGVTAETRRRLERLAMSWQEPFTLWDVDLPADLERMRQSDLRHLIPEPGA